MNKNIFITVSITLLISTGCANLGKSSYTVETLTGAESRIISEEISYNNTIYPMMTDLILLSDPSKVFDSSGTYGPSAFSAEILDGLQTIIDFKNQDRIYSAELWDTRGAQCMKTTYDCHTAIFVDDGVLANGEIPYCLLHEAIHINGDGHSNTLEDWIDRNDSHTDDIDFFNIIQQEKDVPYLADTFYDISDDLYYLHNNAKEGCDEYNLNDNKERVEYFATQSCELWVEDRADDLWDGFNVGAWEEVLTELDVSLSELEGWIEDSGLCEEVKAHCQSLL